jgi:hypothetical protein
MRLTAQQIFEATPVLASIINERRPMPLKGAYRLARMHAKLYAEFLPIEAKRDEIITAYRHRAAEDAPMSVPTEKLADFRVKWAEIAGETVDVDIEPIPLSLLDLGDETAGSISALELISLGDLVIA